MKNFLISAVVTSLVATQSIAGSVIYAPPPEAEIVVEEPEQMGGSAAWWIPLLAIGAIILMTRENCEVPQNEANFACGAQPPPP